MDLFDYWYCPCYAHETHVIHFIGQKAAPEKNSLHMHTCWMNSLHSTQPPVHQNLHAGMYHAIDRDLKDFYRQEMVYRVGIVCTTIWVDDIQCKPGGDVDHCLRKLTCEIDYIYHILNVDKSDFALK